MTKIVINGKEFDAPIPVTVSVEEKSKIIAKLVSNGKEYVLKATKDGKLILN